MKYKVVYGGSEYLDQAIKELNSEVNKLIEEGWTPQGGASQSVTDYGYYCISQAMIKTPNK